MKPTPEDVIRRLREVETRKSAWNTTFAEAQEYGTPHHERVGSDNRSRGGVRNDRTFTGIVEEGVRQFASRLMTTLFPALSRWVQYHHVLDKQNEFKDVIEAIQKRTHDVINGTQSNFYAKVHESFTDLAIGTGCVAVLPHPEGYPLMVDVIPLNEFFLEETVPGVPPNVYRRYTMTKRQLKSTYPGKVDYDQQEATSIVEDGLEVIEACIYQPAVTGSTDKDAGYYHHYVILEEEQALLKYQRFRTQPFIAFRWSKNPAEFYGRGPVVEKLPDIRVLNYMTELSLKNAEFTALRTYTATDDRVINQENYTIRPGSILQVRTNSPSSSRGRSIELLSDNIRFEPGTVLTETLEERILQALLADDMGPVDQPSKSPLEVSIRHRQLMKRMGASYGRLQDELIGPMLHRILDLCNEAGVYNDIAMEWAAKEMGEEVPIDEVAPVFTEVVIENLQYKSPLSVMAKQDLIGSFEMFFSLVVNSFGPNALALMVKPQEVVQDLADVLNIPMDLLTSKEEMEALQRAAEQAIAQGGNALPQQQQQQGAPQ